MAEIQLTNAQRAAVAALGTPSGVEVAPGSLVSDAITLFGSSTYALDITPDTEEPVLQGWKIDLNSGNLTLTFSEPVSSVDPRELTFNGNALTTTSGNIQASDPAVVVIALSSSEVAALSLIDEDTATVEVGAALVSDVNQNAADTITPVPTGIGTKITVSEDGISAVLASATTTEQKQVLTSLVAQGPTILLDNIQAFRSLVDLTTPEAVINNGFVYLVAFLSGNTDTVASRYDVSNAFGCTLSGIPEDHTIVTATLPTSGFTLPANTITVGEVLSFNLFNLLGTSVTRGFNIPVTFHLSNRHESTSSYRLYHRNDTTGIFSDSGVSPSVVGTDVTFPLTHFSEYILVEVPAEDPANPFGSGGGGGGGCLFY